MNKVHMPNKRFVSKGKYTVLKMLAFALSGGGIICVAGILLLLINMFYWTHVEAQWEAACIAQGNVWDPLISFAGLAQVMFIFLSPLLLIAFFVLWFGGRKSWKTVRAIQPISYADTSHLPAAGSLVRASQEPAQAQETVLLRASTMGQEKREEQLLRAAAGAQE